MEKFYFTYGSDGHPFIGGWTEIIAPSKEVACAVFRGIHPCKYPDILNCCSVYTMEQFATSSMNGPNGNLGHGCWEVITVTITPMAGYCTGTI